VTRPSWGPIAGLVDQASLALGSFFLLGAVGVSGSASDLGGYALVQAVLVLIIGAYRTIMGTVVLTRPIPLNRMPDLRLGSFALTASFGVLASVITAAAAWIFTQSPLVTVGFSLWTVAVLIADNARFLSYRESRPWLVVAFSLPQLAFAVCAFLVARYLAVPWEVVILGYAVGLWLVCPLVAIFSLTQAKMRPAWLYVRSEARAQVPALGTLVLVSSGAQLLTPYAVGVVSGLSGVGAFRTSQAVSSLGLQIPQGLQPLVLARSSEALRRTGQFDFRYLRQWSVAAIASMTIITAAILLASDTVGGWFFGSTWAAVRPAVPWMSASLLLAQLSSGMEIYFKAVGSLRSITVNRVFTAPASVASAAVGAAMAGAFGASVGLLVVNIVIVILTLRLLLQELTTRKAPPR